MANYNDGDDGGGGDAEHLAVQIFGLRNYIFFAVEIANTSAPGNTPCFKKNIHSYYWL